MNVYEEWLSEELSLVNYTQKCCFLSGHQFCFMESTLMERRPLTFCSKGLNKPNPWNKVFELTYCHLCSVFTSILMVLCIHLLFQLKLSQLFLATCLVSTTNGCVYSWILAFLGFERAFYVHKKFQKSCLSLRTIQSLIWIFQREKWCLKRRVINCLRFITILIDSFLNSFAWPMASL